MFTVVDKETGETYVVYGIAGNYFLIYDEAADVWEYKRMSYCRPCKPEEVSKDAIAALEAELAKVNEEKDELLMTIRFHSGCDFCKYEELHADEQPCDNCRGTGGKQDKWEWRRPEEDTQ